MSRTALLLIDFQNDYFASYEGAKWPLEGAEAAAEKGARLLEAFRAREWPVIHVRHEFPTRDAPFFVPASEGARIHATVQPKDHEPVVLKHQVNSFKDTDLRAILEERGVDTVVICGAMSHMCVDAATRAASDLGYTCSVAHDACATRDVSFGDDTVPAREVHAAFMSALGFAYAKVAGTEELLRELDGLDPERGHG